MPVFFSEKILQYGFLIKHSLSSIFSRLIIVLIVTVIAGSLAPIIAQTPPFFNQAPVANIFADTTAKLYIQSLSITGNKRTKNYIIEREMLVKQGDSVIASRLFEILKQSRDLVYNTTLFTEVEITPVFITGTDVHINIILKEKWYIYPSPQFQLVDRNFNEWIKTYNGDLERVIYGVKFAHYNLSGRRDQLKIYLLNGYARNFSFNYSAPYSNRRLTEGFSAGAGFTQNREVIYQTDNNNVLSRYNSNGFSRSTLTAYGAYQKRNGYYRKHVYTLGFTYSKVADTITKVLNPAYFNNGMNHTLFPELGYAFHYTNTNNIQYPLTGLIFSLSATKKGIEWSGGINSLSLFGGVSRYTSHGRNWFSVFEAQTLLKLPFRQAYINQRGLGYGDYYLRGLENYVVDGVASAVGKYTLKKKIISFDIPVPVKNQLVPKIPITIFAKTFGDVGYIYNRDLYNTRLNNTMLYTGGFGIDVLTLYDINIKLEYSFNQLGEKGLFLHGKGGF